VDKNVFEGVHHTSGHQPLRMRMTAKEFRNAQTKELERLKQRSCVDGRFQDDPEMDEGTSNVRFESFLTLLNASLNYRDKHGNRYVKKCVDVVTAFLIPDVHQDLYVFVPAEEANILCDLDERLRPFLRQDGTLLARLLKAIYGLRQGSAEFQLHVTNKLARFGFKPCGAERGVYIKHLPHRAPTPRRWLSTSQWWRSCGCDYF
jgi:hypothetical protein